jgi:glycosyltransferase involved in cell wall biosynthesis
LEHGGTERFLCRLLNRLADDPVRHVLCTLRHAGDRAADLDARVRVVPLALPRRSHLSFLKLAKTLRAMRPAVVHARNACTWTDALLACHVARGPRLVLGFHGLQNATRFTAGQRLRLRALGAARQRFTAVSHAGKAMIAEDLGCRPERISVLANGVDVLRFCPAHGVRRTEARRRWGIHDDQVAVGNLGNMFTPIKGHAVLIEAFAQVVAHQPRARLLLAGFGPLHDELAARVRGLALTESVQFLGNVDDPADLLAALDVYVCPSLAEGMSNALLEAMACGLPCVATDVADHRRMFSRFDAANLLVMPGRAGALAQAVGTLLADGHRRSMLGVRARDYVEENHTLDAAVAVYSSYYHAMLSAGSPQMITSCPAQEAAAWTS